MNDEGIFNWSVDSDGVHLYAADDVYVATVPLYDDDGFFIVIDGACSDDRERIDGLSTLGDAILAAETMLRLLARARVRQKKDAA